jgi:reverse gyrase
MGASLAMRKEIIERLCSSCGGTGIDEGDGIHVDTINKCSVCGGEKIEFKEVSSMDVFEMLKKRDPLNDKWWRNIDWTTYQSISL